MAGVEIVVGIEFADARHWHAHRCREIAGAENQGFEARRRLRDFAGIEESGGGFDLGFDANGPGEAMRGLDLREQSIDELHIARGIGFRQHDEIDVGAGRLHDFDQVAIREVRVERVDAEDAK